MRDGEKRGTLNLADARERTPAVSPVEAMRRQLALAVFDAVKEKDLTDMVDKLKAMALAGDHKAMKMYFELVGVMGKQQTPPASAESAVAGQVAEALRDLVDEIRVAKARAEGPPLHERKRIGNGVRDEE